MKWFELGSDRMQAADLVFEHDKVELVTDGYKRTAWTAQAIGATCIISHYQNRTTYDRHLGMWVTTAQPFYMSQLSYKGSEGQRIDSVIEFNGEHAMVKRSSEYTRYEDPVVHANRIWDEAMWMLDESLRERADAIGVLLTMKTIERPNMSMPYDLAA